MSKAGRAAHEQTLGWFDRYWPDPHTRAIPLAAVTAGRRRAGRQCEQLGLTSPWSLGRREDFCPAVIPSGAEQDSGCCVRLPTLSGTQGGSLGRYCCNDFLRRRGTYPGDAGLNTLLSRRDNNRPGHVLTLSIVLLPFVALAVAIRLLWDRQVNAQDIVLCLGLYAVTAMGITIGFHRLTTHRSFVAVPPIRALLLLLGSMAVEGPVVYWVATHLEHHAKSDREGDPHSPREGFWHAHIGWMLGAFAAKPEVYARHLRQDRLVQFMSRTFFAWVAVSMVLPGLLDGWLSRGLAGGFGTGFWHGLLWAGLVRMGITHHVTWSVNSLCHTFGSRPFDATRDRSRNNWLVGLLAFGEGWHNNHHAFPAAAYHGFTWWQIDVSAYCIRLFRVLGLARDVQMPSSAAVRREMAREQSTAATQPAGQQEGRDARLAGEG
jgi:stearoyl-CoA desaturase (delta-9 desaturase)